MGAVLPFFAVFVVLWGLQLWSTHIQAQRFMAEVGRLRGLGETAIGVSSERRIKPRTYVALSADHDARVTGAVELSGITVLARPRPVPDLEGRSLTELARGPAEDRRALAAAMAARTILAEDAPDAAET